MLVPRSSPLRIERTVSTDKPLFVEIMAATPRRDITKGCMCVFPISMWLWWNLKAGRLIQKAQNHPFHHLNSKVDSFFLS